MHGLTRNLFRSALFDIAFASRPLASSRTLQRPSAQVSLSIFLFCLFFILLYLVSLSCLYLHLPSGCDGTLQRVRTTFLYITTQIRRRRPLYLGSRMESLDDPRICAMISLESWAQFEAFRAHLQHLQTLSSVLRAPPRTLRNPSLPYNY